MKYRFSFRWKLATFPVLVASMFVACAQSPSSPSTGSGSMPDGGGSLSSRSPPSGDPRQNLMASYKKLKSAYPYRLTETMSGGAAEAGGKRVAEFAAVDRVHTTWNGQETIRAGGKTYSKSGEKWVESAITRQPSGTDHEEIFESLLKEVRLSGTETVNGVACAVYTLRFDGVYMEVQATGDGKAWVGLEDGLPHQSEAELKIKGQSAGKSRIVYEYDPNITVKEPER